MSETGTGSPLKGYAFALASAAMGAVYFLMGTLLIKRWSGMGVREFALTVYVWAAILGVLGVPLSAPVSAMRISRGQLGAVALLSVLFAGNVVLPFDAIRHIDPTTVQTLQRTSIFFTLVLGFVVLGERLTRLESAGATLILAAITLMVGRGHGAFDRGTMEGLGAAVCVAFYQFVAKRTMARVPPAVVNAYRNIGVLALLALYSWLTDHPPASATGPIYATLILAAFVGPFLHSYLQLTSIKLLPLSHGTLMVQTQPLFVLALTWIIVRLWPTLGAAGPAGGSMLPSLHELAIDALIMAGVVALLTSGFRKSARTPEAAPASQAAPAAPLAR